MEINLLEVAGWRPSFKAMRLPLKSHNKADSYQEYEDDIGGFILGPNDESLMIKLINAGDEHAKALRGVEVWLEITAPLYWWLEADTYRIGYDCLSSTSSMHCELKGLIGEELQKEKGKLTGDYEYTKIVKINYQALRRMYFQRRYHRLPEWKQLCEFLTTLPYFKELCLNEKTNNTA